MCSICFSVERVSEFTGNLEIADLQLDPQATGGGRSGANIQSVSATGITGVDALLQGNGWSDATLTFSFPTASDQYTDYIYYGATELPTFSALSLEFREAIRQILGGGTLEGGGATFGFGSVASFTNVNFSETTGGDGLMRFANSENPSVAWGYYPWATGGEAGDAWFNPTYMGQFPTPAPGTYTWLTAIHELGHTLGLKHGHQTGGIINSAVPTEMDSLEFTVMTYRSYVGAGTSGYTVEGVGYPQTFMQLDIRALQQMYGADFTVNGTDTVYTWNPTTGEMSINGVGQGAPAGNRVLLTVWDGNGEDTYDFSNYSGGATIDLTPGGFSLFSETQRSHLGNGNYARGNVFNALQYNDDVRSLIENAIGTSGDDIIVGNIANNRLEGGNGADIISGGSGDDSLQGGGGNDELNGGADHDTLAGGGGDDVLKGGSGHDSLNGGSGDDNLSGNDGDDLLQGATGRDRLTGGAGTDTLQGGEDNDVLNGGSGDDSLNGGEGADRMDGGTGSDTASYRGAIGPITVDLTAGTGTGGWAEGDTLSNIENILGTRMDDILSGDGVTNVLTGGVGNDSLDGLAGDDQLFGGVGADTLNGGDGNDLLNGGSENDTLNGGAGSDTINGGSGADVMNGGAGFDTMNGGSDNDILNGGGDADTLLGGSGNDDLFGGQGDDTIDGGADDDTIEGSAGNDILTGGNGDDLFVFSGASGADVITDFTAGLGVGDVIRLDGSIFTDYADVRANTTNDGLGNCVISKGGVSITLTGVIKADLASDDFVFTAPGSKADAVGPLTLPVEPDIFDPLVLPTGLETKGSADEAPVICPPGDPTILSPQGPDLDSLELGLGTFGGRDPHRYQMGPRDYDWVA